MQERKRKLLNSIIDEYISSVEPIGSNLLVGKYKLKLSPATVRNEMMELEKDGYIYQPHTSAGRVPTEKGYKFYVSNFLRSGIDKKAKERFKNIIKENNELELSVKQIAKEISEESKGVMIVAFKANNIYYTGISNLFSQPEFYQHRLVCNLSEVIDRMEEVIYEYYGHTAGDRANILIGADNPFDNACSSIMARLKVKYHRDILMCLLGPMRMNYNKNVGLMECVKNLLEQLNN